ncbi:MAG: TMEM175 family protein [Pseudomonadales bacterium]
MRTDRIETLCDGIFAIVMTLLVLNLSVPVVTAEAELFNKLLAMWPKFLAYVISFVVLGVIWSFHHRLLDVVRKSDGWFLWMNICFFMIVAFVPFTTELISEYRHWSAAIVIYGIDSVASFMLLYCQCWYASAGGRLIDECIQAKSILELKVTFAGGAMASIAAIGFSFVNTNISIFIFAIVYAVFVVFVVTRGMFDGRAAQADSKQNA